MLVDRHCDWCLGLFYAKFVNKSIPDRATDESKSNEIFPSGLG